MSGPTKLACALLLGALAGCQSADDNVYDQPAYLYETPGAYAYEPALPYYYYGAPYYYAPGRIRYYGVPDRDDRFRHGHFESRRDQIREDRSQGQRSEERRERNRVDARHRESRPSDQSRSPD